MLLAVAAIAIFAGPIMLGAVQTLPPLEFEVASLKLVPNGRPGTRPLACKGVDGIVNIIGFRSAAPEGLNVPQGRCIGSERLNVIIAMAYDIPPLRIVGDPDWADHYQIDAKAEDPSTARTDQLRQMLRTLLIDRFKLQVHTELKDVEGYLLLVGKDGVKLLETSGTEEIPGARPPAPGMDRSQIIFIHGNFRLNRFSDFLWRSPIFGRPVIDKTALPGIYAFTMTLNRISAPDPGLRSEISTIEFDPPLDRALEEQLGLRLEPGKVPVEHLVIDHAERPADN